MKDNEIIKALECHSNDYSFCMECPFSQRGECSCELSRNALDLINRQKAENERLNKKVEELSEVLSDTIRIRYAEAKAEAVKEFAERLKVLCRQARFSVTVTQDLTGKQRLLDNIAVVDENDIDNLVKEMEGEG